MGFSTEPTQPLRTDLGEISFGYLGRLFVSTNVNAISTKVSSLANAFFSYFNFR